MFQNTMTILNFDTLKELNLKKYYKQEHNYIRPSLRGLNRNLKDIHKVLLEQEAFGNSHQWLFLACQLDIHALNEVNIAAQDISPIFWLRC